MPSGWPQGGIWLSRDPADMRRSFDGLCALVSSHLGCNPTDGRWYVFINRRRTIVKVLGFERGGFFIWSKCLEQGLFGPPPASNHAALALLSIAGRKRGILAESCFFGVGRCVGCRPIPAGMQWHSGKDFQRSDKRSPRASGISRKPEPVFSVVVGVRRFSPCPFVPWLFRFSSIAASGPLALNTARQPGHDPADGFPDRPSLFQEQRLNLFSDQA